VVKGYPQDHGNSGIQRFFQKVACPLLFPFEIRAKAEEGIGNVFLHHCRKKDRYSSQFHQKDGQDTKTGTRYSAYSAEGGN
jgi:hypothetical protein